MRTSLNLTEFVQSSQNNFTFVNTSQSSMSDAYLQKEFAEELQGEFGINAANQRWPNVPVDKLPFMNNVNEFIKAVRSSPIVNLSFAQIKTIHNNAQLENIIAMISKGYQPEQIKYKTSKFFARHTTEGGKYNKNDSFLRWAETFRTEQSYQGTNWPPEPPIILKYNNKLYHMTGQTRQCGALVNRKIMPYVVIDANKYIQQTPLQPQPNFYQTH